MFPCIHVPRDFDELGIRGRFGTRIDLQADASKSMYDFYANELQASIQRLQLTASDALLRRGESFIWAANLLHGGKEREDSTKSRLSMVTHYWLEGAEKYWTPRFSYPALNKYNFRQKQPICHSNGHTDCAALGLEWFKKDTLMTYAREKGLKSKLINYLPLIDE
jgi:hypothetical protein